MNSLLIPGSFAQAKVIIKILKNYPRKFFITPPFPLEIFAETEKSSTVWMKY
jgi:hypothetical protein